MEVAGAKVIRLAGGRNVILSVASTVMKDGSAGDRLRAERVCRTKAIANVVAEQRGVQVAHMEELTERTRIVIDNQRESGSSVSELLQVTKTKVEGIAKDMPVIGRWRSKDGEVFYLAIGSIVGKDGAVAAEAP
jgi:nanoRNase/pAp phosphatase (c-di-AMP/oligoRNAs hydrolase)